MVESFLLLPFHLLPSSVLTAASEGQFTIPAGVYKNRNEIVGLGNLTAIELDYSGDLQSGAKLRLLGCFADHDFMLGMSDYRPFKRNAMVFGGPPNYQDCFHFVRDEKYGSKQLNKVMKKIYKDLDIPYGRESTEARLRFLVCSVSGTLIAYFGSIFDADTRVKTLAFPVQLERFDAPRSPGSRTAAAAASDELAEYPIITLERIFLPRPGELIATNGSGKVDAAHIEITRTPEGGLAGKVSFHSITLEPPRFFRHARYMLYSQPDVASPLHVTSLALPPLPLRLKHSFGKVVGVVEDKVCWYLDNSRDDGGVRESFSAAAEVFLKDELKADTISLCYLRSVCSRYEVR
ncbi:hypothetical protein FOZ63_019421 [Perkinsus olseni]|uniref:Uncharacterized protein n=1 Tax=Perkinsus olseni TaxID=32597 RepID=A0A7J6Q3K3_PEROL|nr:hypothetical protein FOZ63_019421 [Perkinsus olseni]KAF4714284.1 hypothetical protein FOZ62_019186 [Perkinsus olseni]